MSNSPRHKSWPAPPPVRLSTDTGNHEQNLANAKANAAAAAEFEAMPSPAPRAIPRSSTTVRAFAPAVIHIDVSMQVETPAIEYSLWGGGYQGHGLPIGNPTVPAWCSWHLIQAWMRNLDKYFTNPPKSKKRKAGSDEPEAASAAAATDKAPARSKTKEQGGRDNPVTKAMIRKSLIELRDNTVQVRVNRVTILLQYWGLVCRALF